VKSGLPIDIADINVFGNPIVECSLNPLTGYYRNGKCATGADDHGTHTVCSEMTEDFLDFTRSRGNDLSSAKPQWGFPGLKPKDRWCLCAMRWKEALDFGVAPLVVLEATNKKTLDYVSIDQLQGKSISLYSSTVSDHFNKTEL